MIKTFPAKLLFIYVTVAVLLFCPLEQVLASSNLDPNKDIPFLKNRIDEMKKWEDKWRIIAKLHPDEEVWKILAENNHEAINKLEGLVKHKKIYKWHSWGHKKYAKYTRWDDSLSVEENNFLSGFAKPGVNAPDDLKNDYENEMKARQSYLFHEMIHAMQNLATVADFIGGRGEPEAYLGQYVYLLACGVPESHSAMVNMRDQFFWQVGREAQYYKDRIPGLNNADQRLKEADELIECGLTLKRLKGSENWNEEDWKEWNKRVKHARGLRDMLKNAPSASFTQTSTGTGTSEPEPGSPKPTIDAGSTSGSLLGAFKELLDISGASSDKEASDLKGSMLGSCIIGAVPGWLNFSKSSDDQEASEIEAGAGKTQPAKSSKGQASSVKGATGAIQGAGISLPGSGGTAGAASEEESGHQLSGTTSAGKAEQEPAPEKQTVEPSPIPEKQTIEPSPIPEKKTVKRYPTPKKHSSGVTKLPW